MLIRRVTAHSFGPLSGDELEFADSLTVVYGSNESAKSSWHAACYAALCGRRRGRRPSRDDIRFEERHRPWDGGQWLVSAELLLDDGRRVEMRQDLHGKVDCHAKDLDLGADLSAEIMGDGGVPDATRWVGLDRHSFAATACVFQTKVLSVLDQAGSLRELVQRSAASAGGQHSAASALARLEAFHSEEVGSARATTKPLSRAMAAVEAARHAQTRARHAHAQYQSQLAIARAARQHSDAADRELRLHEAAQLSALARSLREKADEAIDINRRLGGVEPRSALSDRELMDDVAASLAAWRDSLVAPAPPSPAPAPRRDRSADARSSVAVPAPAAAPPPTSVDIEIDDAELFELARALEVVPAPVDQQLVDRVDLANAALAGQRHQLSRGRRRRAIGTALAAVALAVLVAGLTSSTMIVAIAGLVVLATGAGMAVAAGRAIAERGRLTSPLRLAAAELRAAEQDLVVARQNAAAATEAIAAARSRCVGLGLSADPHHLRALARARAGGVVLADRDQQWNDELTRRRQAVRLRILKLAERCGIDLGGTAGADADADADAEAVAVGLGRWMDDRHRDLTRYQRDRDDWVRLVALCDGRGVDDLVAAADTARDTAASCREGFTADEVQSAGVVDDSRLRFLRQQARQATEAAIAAEESTKERARTLVDLAEAHEEVARAEAELDRLSGLDQTLSLTMRLLASAERRAHRDIAPILARGVRGRLPELTGGRYTDVIVDPGTLRVQVCDAARTWRDADRLSFGTAEQIYFLLRLAMTEHLSAPGTRCPLLLDDVMVHADATRTERLCDLLLRCSQQRQVIVFTQQEQVRDWARTRLIGEASGRYSLRELPALTRV